MWKSIEELKEALQEEWSKITMQEVQACIAKMPRKCQKLVESSGGLIRSELW